MKLVAKLDDIEVGKAIAVQVGEESIALFRKSDQEIYAVNNMCPHQGGPLVEGYVDGFTVTCPWHAWNFDIRTGACETVPQDRIRSYPVCIKGQDILLEV